MNSGIDLIPAIILYVIIFVGLLILFGLVAYLSWRYAPRSIAVRWILVTAVCLVISIPITLFATARLSAGTLVGKLELERQPELVYDSWDWQWDSNLVLIRFVDRANVFQDSYGPYRIGASWSLSRWSSTQTRCSAGEVTGGPGLGILVVGAAIIAGFCILLVLRMVAALRGNSQSIPKTRSEPQTDQDSAGPTKLKFDDH